MDAPVQAAVIAGSVAAVGWFVSYLLNSIANRTAARRGAALAHIECQLEQLYGPLAFLVLEGRQTFQELLRILGRSHVFEADGSIASHDLRTWLFWAEEDLLPRNEKIKQLLSEKTHLLLNSRMLDSYIEFLNHHNSWMIQHRRWQKERVRYSWHSPINWPAQFEKDVLDAFWSLQDEHARLIRIGRRSLWSKST